MSSEMGINDRPELPRPDSEQKAGSAPPPLVRGPIIRPAIHRPTIPPRNTHPRPLAGKPLPALSTDKSPSVGSMQSQSVSARPSDRYFELKSEIHKKLIGVLNLDRVSSIPKERVRSEIGRVVERLLEDERVPMTTAEQNKI